MFSSVGSIVSVFSFSCWMLNVLCSIRLVVSEIVDMVNVNLSVCINFLCCNFSDCRYGMVGIMNMLVVLVIMFDNVFISGFS